MTTRDAANALSRRVSDAQRPQLQPLLAATDDYKNRIAAYLPAYEHEQQISRQLGERAQAIGMLVNAFMQDELVQTRNNINLAQLQMGITTLIAIIAGVLIAGASRCRSPVRCTRWPWRNASPAATCAERRPAPAATSWGSC